MKSVIDMRSYYSLSISINTGVVAFGMQSTATFATQAFTWSKCKYQLSLISVSLFLIGLVYETININQLMQYLPE